MATGTRSRIDMTTIPLNDLITQLRDTLRANPDAANQEGTNQLLSETLGVFNQQNAHTTDATPRRAPGSNRTGSEEGAAGGPGASTLPLPTTTINTHSASAASMPNPLNSTMPTYADPSSLLGAPNSMAWDYGGGYPPPVSGYLNMSNIRQQSSTPSARPATFFELLREAGGDPNRSLNNLPSANPYQLLNDSDQSQVERVHTAMFGGGNNSFNLGGAPLNPHASSFMTPRSNASRAPFGGTSGQANHNVSTPINSSATGGNPSTSFGLPPAPSFGHTYPPAPPPQPQFSYRELTLPKFSGDGEEYLTWKRRFRSQADPFPEHMRATYLFDALDKGSQAFVGHLDLGAPTAYEDCFAALDERNSSNMGSEQAVLIKVARVVAGPKAKNLAELEHIFNIIHTAFHKLRNAGISTCTIDCQLVSIHRILFGLSRSGVERLQTNAGVNTPDVLKAIWRHIKLLRAQAAYDIPGSLFRSSVDSEHDASGSPVTETSLKAAHAASERQKKTPRNFFKCSLCQTNEHTADKCKLSPAEQVAKCNEYKLCYVCFKPYHLASQCHSLACRCTCANSENLRPHHPRICKDFK